MAWHVWLAGEQLDLWDSTSKAAGTLAASRLQGRNGSAAPSADEKVEYEGMLISAAAAEGRR